MPFFYFSILLLFISCARQPVESPLESMRTTDAPEIVKDDLDFAQFIEALKINIKVLKQKKDRLLTFGPMNISASDYAKSLDQVVQHYKKHGRDKTILFIQKNFVWNEVYGRDRWGEIMMTSYYEPLYEGRLKPEGEFIQPLYALPKDLVEVELSAFSQEDIGDFETKRNKVGARIIQSGSYPKIVPFFNRDEIDIQKKLANRGLELFYLDPIEAFFLQIQGSGIIKLKNGVHKRVSYAGQNGFKYESIGKHLFDVIPKEEMSLQRIEAHLRTLSKEELYRFLTINPSYVFFQKLKNGRGRTTFGPEVVAGRTIAIDASLFPLGSVGFLSFKKPIFENKESIEPTDFVDTSRFVLAQDTGGAIKTAGRADLFWGEGDEALQYAGVLRHPAKLWFLVPR